MRRSIVTFCVSAFIALISISSVSAFSTYAFICNIGDTIQQPHGNTAQTTTGGYTFTMPTTVIGGNTYQVGIGGTGASFNGFIIYAADTTGNHIGSWAATAANTQNDNTGNCNAQGFPVNSLLQHSAAGPFGPTVTWAWTAPATAQGAVTFNAVIMSPSKPTFWRMTSNAVTVTPAPTTAPPPTVAGQTTTTTITTTTKKATAAAGGTGGTGTGATNGTAGAANGACVNNGMLKGTITSGIGMTLDYILDTAQCMFTWTVTGPSTSWVSVGICTGPTMRDNCDYLVAWVSNGVAYAADTWSTADSLPAYDEKKGGTSDFQVVSGSVTNGQTTVTVTRKFNTGDPYDQPLLSNTMQALQFSYGPPTDPAPTTAPSTFPSYGIHPIPTGYIAAQVNFYTGAATVDQISKISAGAWLCIFVSAAIGGWGVIRWSRKLWKEIRRQKMLAHFTKVAKDITVPNDDVIVSTESKMAADENGTRFTQFKGKRPPMLAPQVLNDNSRAVQLWRSKWQTLKDAEGNVYYFNEELYTTAWDIPPMPDYFAAANMQQTAPPSYPGGSSANRLAAMEEGQGWTNPAGRVQAGWQQKAPPQAAMAARHQRTKSAHSQAMVAKAGSSGERSVVQLLKSWWNWRLPGTASSMADLIVFGIYLAANLIAYFALDTTTAGGMPDNKNKLGYLAAGNMLIVALPATRNSILVWFLGFPFDRVIVFHRWIGRFVILVVLLHMAYYLSYWNMNGITASSQLSISKNAYGVVAFAFMLGILATSFGWLRRTHFNVFFYSHFMFILAYMFTYLHIPMDFYPYLVALLVIYGLDRLIRFILGLQVHQTVTIQPKDGDIIQVRFPKNCIGKALNRYKIGQYVFVNFPELSLFEWHPFTLSSSPRETTAEVHIRSLGDHTKKLMEHVRGKGVSMKIRVDGPYGNHRFTYRRYPALMLVGGGIGITPIVAILRDVFNVGDFANPNEFAPSVIDAIYIAWVVPSIDKYKWFKQEFEECWMKLANSTHRLPSLNIWIYASRSSPQECQGIEQEGMSYGSGTQFMSGKPDFDAMMNVIREKHPNTAVSVFACGPQQLTGDVWDSSNQQKAAGHRFDFHHETFDW